MTGKEKCKYLKTLRAAVANAYNIEGFEYKDCDFVEECSGTCPACDAEAQLLYQKLQELGHELDVEALKSSELDLKIDESNRNKQPVRYKPKRTEGKIVHPKNNKNKLIDKNITIGEFAGLILPPELPENETRQNPKDKSEPLGGNIWIDTKNSKDKQDNNDKKTRGLRGLFKKKK